MTKKIKTTKNENDKLTELVMLRFTKNEMEMLDRKKNEAGNLPRTQYLRSLVVPIIMN